MENQIFQNDKIMRNLNTKWMNLPKTIKQQGDDAAGVIVEESSRERSDSLMKDLRGELRTVTKKNWVWSDCVTEGLREVFRPMFTRFELQNHFMEIHLAGQRY